MASKTAPTGSPSTFDRGTIIRYAGVTLVAAALLVMAAYLVALDRRQREILEELQNLRTLLNANPRTPPAPQNSSRNSAATAFPTNLSLTVDDGAVKGRREASLTIVEFSDFECPFCARYVRDTFHQIEREFVDTGKVRYAFRHTPIERLHPHAFKAAEAAECARRQGKFWQMHDHLFANQKALRLPDLFAAGRSIGLDEGALRQCLDGQATAKVRQDLATGTQAGISGTPAFFIGETQQDGSVRVLRKLIGAQSAESFRSVLKGLLSGS